MQIEIRFIIVIITIITGLLNFIVLGYSLALSSGGSELTAREIFAHVFIWTSLIHALISSWLFLYFNIFGRIISLLTSFIGLIGTIPIMTNAISFFWLFIALCFFLTLCAHSFILTKTLRY